MIGTSGAISHKMVTAQPNNSAYDVSANAWNATMAVTSLAPDGYLFVKDSTAPDGWSLVNSNAVPAGVAGNLTVTGNISAVSLSLSGNITNVAGASQFTGAVSCLSTLACANFVATNTQVNGTFNVTGVTQLAGLSLTGAIGSTMGAAFQGALSTTTTLSVTGNVLTVLRVPNGTTALPAYAFSADASTGLWYSAGGGTTLISFAILGVTVAALQGGGNAPAFSMASLANGNSSGPFVSIGYNNSSTGAPGWLSLTTRLGVGYSVWIDASATPGIMRLQAGGGPTVTSGDVTGTIVGAQVSMRAFKELVGPGIAPHDALAVVLQTPVHEFVYRGGAYNGSVFHGIVADESPIFVMDPAPGETLGRVFNPISAHGVTIQAMKALAARVVALEAEIGRLGGTVH